MSVFSSYKLSSCIYSSSIRLPSEYGGDARRRDDQAMDLASMRVNVGAAEDGGEIQEGSLAQQNVAVDEYPANQNDVT